MDSRFFDIDSYTIHYRYFPADNNNAIVVLVHGHGEHIGRYERWAARFAPYNYMLCGVDLPGHGLSSGKRGHIRQYDDYYAILDQFIEILQSDFPNRPIILYGHSMGGNIVSSYILERQPQVKAAILSSPWLELAIKPPVFQFWLAKIMYKIFPSYGDHTRLNPNFISRIPEEVERYRRDKLVHDQMTPGLFIPCFFKGIKNVKQGKRFYLPTLVFHGTGDQLTSHKASFRFSEHGEKIYFKSYEGGYHELHHDLVQDELFDDILDWMSTHVVMR